MRILRGVAGLLMLLVLSACLRVDADLELSVDETLTGTVLLAVSDAWAREQGQEPSDLAAAMAEELAAAPDSGIVGEPFADGEFTGSLLTFTNVPVQRVVDATNGALQISVDDAHVRVEADLRDLGEGTDIPWSVHLALTFPHAVATHNGSLEGRTVTWDLDANNPELWADSAPPPPFLARVPAPVWVLLGLVALTAAGVTLSRKRRPGTNQQPRTYRERQAELKHGSSGITELIAERRGREGPTGSAPRGRSRD